MKASTLVAAVATVGLVLTSANSHAATMSLIGGSIAAGNGDFNYEGGGTVSGVGSATPNENIPRDRFLVGSANVNATVNVDGWIMRRLAYSGGNNAFGLDGNFGLDNEPADTGSGQAFTNGNSSTIVDLIADTINVSYNGMAGDVFDLSYLLGSDSNTGTGSANATVTLTLDAGLPSEQVSAFAVQTRTGVMRDGSTSVAEQYISTGSYSTVDLVLQMNPNVGTRSLIDDVRLSVDAVVPEPSSVVMALLGTAFAGAVGMRSRLG